MPKRQETQWGISFSTSVSSAGYCWQLDPWRQKEVLAECDRYVEEGTAVYATAGAFEIKTTGGIRQARFALRAFLGLARELDKLTHPVSVLQHPDGAIERSFDGPQLTDGEREELLKAKVQSFANKYGLLGGDSHPNTLDEWLGEAKDFLQLERVAHALRTGTFGEFDQHMDKTDERVFYRARNQRWVIARRGDSVEEQDINRKRTKDWYDIAAAGSSRTRAQMLFAARVNGKMAGGLSLQAHSLNARKAYIEPKTLLHLLYTRLWLDVVGHEQLERETNCLACDRPLSGTARKKYCDDTCRKAAHRRMKRA